MAIGVYRPAPKKQNNDLGQLLQVGGLVAGGMTGGFSGAMAGANAGQMAGGLLGGGGEQDAGPAQVETGGDAMSRRMNALNNEPLRQIRDSIDSLKYVQDDQTRAELAKPLMQADYMARNKQPGRV